MQAGSNTFWKLVETEKDTIWRLARALTHSYAEAQDLVSDTWVEAYRSFPSLREEAAFRKFVSTITVRLHRRKRWRARLFDPLEAAKEVRSDSIRESSHDLELLLHALSRLPARQREAIVLFEITGLSLKEIQAIQGGTLAGVKSRINRARNGLRDMILEPSADHGASRHDVALEGFTLGSIRLQQL